MRSNKKIRLDMKEHITEVNKKMMTYSFTWLLLLSVLCYIPFCGIFFSIFGIGLMKSIINIWHENDAKESSVMFYKHTRTYIKHFLGGMLWILLKCIPGIIISIVGYILLVYADVSEINGSGMHMIIEFYQRFQELPALLFYGLLLYLVGIIVAIVIAIKYNCFSYELIHHDAPDKKARDIVESARIRLQGHVWQWLCMGFHYILLMVLGIIAIFASYLILNMFVHLDAIINAFMLVCIYFAGFIAILTYIIPTLTCAYEELYTDICQESQGSNSIGQSEPVVDATNEVNTSDNPFRD